MFTRRLLPTGRKKAGDRYITVAGNVLKLDGMERTLSIMDGTKIPIEDTRLIEGEPVRAYEQY